MGEPEQSDRSAWAREILEVAADGHQVVGPDFRYRYLNPAAVAQARLPADALLGRTMMEVHPGIEETPMFAVLRRCMTERSAAQVDHEHTYPDGRRAWFELRFQPVSEGLLVVSVDISERIRTESELSRSRRVQTLMSGASLALLRTPDEAQFVAEVCRIAVERAGYRMAWIGEKSHDEGRPVRPLAAAGVDDGYTASMRVEWGDTPRGRGPGGRSIRTGEPVAVRFIGSDPAFEIWRDDARARDYASCISLPYRVDGEVAGAMTIYSREPDAFDDHETRLLTELALNLGNGVQALRARAEAMRASAELRRLNDRLHRLARIVQRLSGVHDLSSLVELVRSAALELVEAVSTTFILRDGDEGVFLTGAESESSPPRRAPWSASFTSDGNGARATPSARSLTVPIRRDDPLGALLVELRDAPSADDLGVLDTLADSAASAMESIRVVGELRDSEDRYRGLVENLEDVVFSTDPEGRFLYLSPSISKYGYDASEVVGHRFTDFVHPSDLPAVEESFARTLGGQLEPRTFRVRDRKGTERFVRTSSRTLVVGGRVTGLTGVMIDVTAQKRAEDQLRVAQRMEAVGHLAGGIAHDFNNLLSVILSYTEFVAEGNLDDGARSDVAQIERAATRATALTRQLLAFGRKQVMEPKLIDLNELLGDLEKMLRRLIGEHIELAVLPAHDLGRVRADPAQVEQVVMNLVVNARDAMPDGGTVTLETRNVDVDARAAEEDPSLAPGAFVVITVRDSGSGMDDLTKQRLFEPFYTTKGVGKGTGLGLSTAHGIVLQSGGRLTFSSELGVGTTFHIYLPRVAVADADARGSVAPAALSGGSETVLLVEDEPAVRQLAERILRTSGYRVLSSGDPVEALALAEANLDRIDLVLTDVVMPKMNGRVLAQRLRVIDPSIKVVFMSGYVGDAIERHGMLDAGTPFLAKPFTARELLGKVRIALDTMDEGGEDPVP